MKFKPSKLLVGLLFAFNCIFVAAQDTLPNYNFDLEKVDEATQLAQGFTTWGDFPVAMAPGELPGSSRAVVISSEETNREFGAFVTQIPGGFKGNMITLSGSVKTEGIENGHAGILIRLNGRTGMLRFDDMTKGGLKGDNDWTELKINLNYPAKKVTDIFVGGILRGDGKAWFDNFSVVIGGKNIELLERHEMISYPAENDHEFDEGSEVHWQKSSPELVANLYKMGKIWGFLKYHHPSIAKGNVNWDYELFRWFHQIEKVPFEQIINQTLDALGPPNKQRKREFPRKKMKLEPENDWIRSPNLFSTSLSDRLTAIEEGKKESQNYYVKTTLLYPVPTFTNEVAFPQMKWDDTGLKLLALFRFWNQTQYFFPNRHLMDEDWDETLKEFIPRMIETEGELAYKLLLTEFIGKIQDTHARITNRNEVLSDFFGRKMAPLQVRFIENKATIVATSPLLPENSLLKAGDVILEVDGKPVEEIASELMPYCSSSNVPTTYRIIGRLLVNTNEPTLRLRVVNGSGEKEVLVPTQPIAEVGAAWPKEGSHKLIGDDIGYLYPGSLASGEIHQIMDKFMDKKGLIIDFRCYPSDFIVFSLTGKYLLNERVPFVDITRGSTSHPGAIIHQNTVKVGKKNKKAFKGKLVVLMDERTQSSAEYHIMAFSKVPNSVVLGSQTAGADGNVTRIELPGKVSTRFSGIGILNPDGSETQRIGIVPDVEVKPTVEGIRTGRDELLEKAIELIQGSSPTD